jgi:hypothetical protein
MGEFTIAAQKTNASKAMAAGPDAREFKRSNLEGLEGRKTVAVEHRGPGEQQGIENVRRQRHFRQPTQAPDHELEDHG